MNILKINGTAISGIYVDAAVSFNKPAKRVQSISVPGRNGNLIIDEGAFDNVLISYPVFEKNSFPMEFDSIVNWLSSLEGYQRIECSNDPTHFRLGRFVVPQTPTAKRLNRDGYYQLSFDCKPQRYLNLGEVPTEIDANPSETYGPADIVSFEAAQEDTISGAEFSIVPQQDLHGYDAPWPAGGGKNKLQTTLTTSSHRGITATVQADGSIVLTGTNDGTNYSSFTINNDVPTENGVTYTLSGGVSNDVYLRCSGVNDYGSGAQIVGDGTATQVYIRVTSGYAISGSITIKPQFEIGSSATAWTPYANLCPITGFTGAEITDRGVNWIDADTLYSAYKQSDGSFIGRGTDITGIYFNIPQALVGQELTFSTYAKVPSGSTITNIRVVANVNGSNINGAFINEASYTLTKVTFTPTSTSDYLKISFGSNSGQNMQFKDVQLELGSTATTYEPYIGTAYDITWQDEAGTVYGGTLEYLGGQAWRLTSDRAIVDFSDIDWTYAQIASRDVFRGDSLQPMPLNKTNAYCSIFKVVGGTELLDVASDNVIATSTTSISSTNTRCYVRCSAYTDATTFKTAMAGQKLVYELATPVTYDLTGEELARIVGQNNVFANCGQSTVVITEPTYFDNPGYFTSKPIIRVYGDGTFRVGDNIITIAAHTQPYIDIDSELQDCYCGDTNMNEYVTFTSGEYPVLVPGSNYVLMGEGITKLIITPNWWEL